MLTLLACTPLTPELYITAIGDGPIEIDTLADSPLYDETGALIDESSPFYTEEISFSLAYLVPGTQDPSTLEAIVLDHIEITYTPLNAEGEIPNHEAGFAAALAPGETGTYTTRAVSFIQKTWTGDQYLGQAVNVLGTLTLTGTTTDTLTPITTTANLDMIFANYVDGTTQGGT